MTYTGIVYISNEIRYVLETAYKVNLAAQNASLAARRAGNARGFQAVSAELKFFSQGLARTMGEMAGDIHAIAQRVSEHYRQQRSSRFFANIVELTGEIPAVKQAHARTWRRQVSALNELIDKIGQFALRLARSIHLCSSGRSLARSAKIEATSGGEWELMLRNVAGDIEDTIEDMHMRLKSIAVRLNQEKVSV